MCLRCRLFKWSFGCLEFILNFCGKVKNRTFSLEGFLIFVLGCRFVSLYYLDFI